MDHNAGAPDREHNFRSLYEKAYPDLLRFVQRRAPRDQAEDVVADAFLVVWRRLDEIPHTSDEARAWLYGITRNILLNSYRSEERRLALGVRLAQAPIVAPSEASHEDVLNRVDLARAWRRLAENHQEAIALAAFEELNSAQAGTVLGISPVAFRLRLSRARRALRLILNHLPPQPSMPDHNAERTTTP